jgi:hypothetical protein
MSGPSSPDDVGSNLIDAYLIAVENELIAAGAPRADRMQVLQNLETQIEEMLAPHPLPFTEEVIRDVLNKLEPPSHFAATYGNGSKIQESTALASSAPQRSFRFRRPTWPIVAAVSAALLVLGCLFGMMTAASGPNGFLVSLTLLSAFIGFVLTPIALRSAHRQLRSDPAAPGRDLVLKSAIVYGTIAPLLLVLLAAEATDGFAPMLFGIAAFFYAQYVLLRRLWTYLSNTLPTPPPASTTNSPNRTAPPPAHPAAPMPAM